MTATPTPRFSERTGERTRGLHQSVVDQLGLLITSGELGEGTQVSPESLCERFGVSRTVVREAIRVLESKGLVLPRPKTGTRVLGQSHWDFLDRDVIAWRVRGPDRARQLDELMDLRGAVETFAVRSCCDHASDEQIDDLLSATADLTRCGRAGDLAGFTEADVRFHSIILVATGNLVFQQFTEPFAAIFHAREELSTLPERVDELTLQEHADLAHAIAERDADRAEATARRLIEEARTEVLHRIGEDGDG